MYVVVVCVVSGPASLIMGVYANGGVTSRIAFCILAVLWIATTARGWQCARQRRWADHREWMIRSYALTQPLPRDERSASAPAVPAEALRPLQGDKVRDKVHVELRTYQNLSHGTEPTAATGTAPPEDAEAVGLATTTWIYSPTRGFLVEKKYHGETDDSATDPDYTYTAAGRLLTRTWERGVTATYTYAAGQLVHTNYSDSTPDVTVAYDSFGRQTSVTNGVATTTYAYDPATPAGRVGAANCTKAAPTDAWESDHLIVL
jgi:YD repeat-containing protein